MLLPYSPPTLYNPFTRAPLRGERAAGLKPVVPTSFRITTLGGRLIDIYSRAYAAPPFAANSPSCLRKSVAETTSVQP